MDQAECVKEIRRLRGLLEEIYYDLMYRERGGQQSAIRRLEGELSLKERTGLTNYPMST
jgi:hypothetical protein